MLPFPLHLPPLVSDHHFVAGAPAPPPPPRRPLHKSASSVLGVNRFFPNAEEQPERSEPACGKFMFPFVHDTEENEK